MKTHTTLPIFFHSFRGSSSSQTTWYITLSDNLKSFIGSDFQVAAANSEFEVFKGLYQSCFWRFGVTLSGSSTENCVYRHGRKIKYYASDLCCRNTFFILTLFYAGNKQNRLINIYTDIGLPGFEINYS